MVIAKWNGQVIAESDDTLVIEGNHYFPETSVRQEFLQPSDHQTTCGWKGVASYRSIEVGGEVNENAVWYYADPKSGAEQLRGRYAFWKGVEVKAEAGAEGDAGADQTPPGASCKIEPKSE